MGIRSRDYMKRPSDDDGDQASTPLTPDAKLEAFLGNFLKRNPRFFLYLTVALVALIIIALFIAKFAK